MTIPPLTAIMTTELPSTAESSLLPVRSRLLHAIDDENFDWASTRVELESELFRQHREDRHKGCIEGTRHAGGRRWNRQLGDEVELCVKVAGETGLVAHAATEQRHEDLRERPDR